MPDCEINRPICIFKRVVYLRATNASLGLIFKIDLSGKLLHKKKTFSINILIYLKKIDICYINWYLGIGK